MAEKLVMLALSPTMEQGTIAKWTKNEGDAIESGDVLCEVETDKATMEYESTAEGTLLKIVVPEGGRVGVGETIAVAGEKGEDISGLLEETDQQKPAQPAESPPEEQPTDGQENAPAPSPTPVREPAPSPGPPPAAPQDGLPPASPLARRMAKERGIDIAQVAGSGPAGRVVKKDIEAFTPSAAPAQAAATGADQTTRVSEKRRVIAQRLSESYLSSPHYFLRNHVRMDSLMDARRQINAQTEQKLSLNSFIIKLCAEALKRHPMVNATWQGDSITTFGRIDIALAVSQKDGLITPVVRNCGAKGIIQIDQELRDLIGRARENKLAPEDYTNSTFSISNLGTFGVREFTAIINPPGSAILAIGEMFKEAVVGENDEIRAQHTSVFTLSCDHRILDGAVAAAFFHDLTVLFEQPLRALL
ncbi:MAG: hypothetical protein GF331_12175 [Chitinivibrionales bacterium]|nr:hypothetical protein [Chitinivibrionales bacterium]